MQVAPGAQLEMKNRILSLALARIRRSGAVEFSRSFYSMLCTAVTAAAARKRSIGGLDIFATNIHTYIAGNIIERGVEESLRRPL